jgi:hypothetical protein
MNANIVVLGLLALVLFAQAYSAVDSPQPELPWVPIQAGKSRSFHSQTRDAGMYIEAVRRKAIISNPDAVYGYKGSTNGSLEWNFLTGICVCPPKPVCPPAPDVIWSNGDADDDICDNVDAGGAFGGYDTVDFGGAADGNVCDV